MRRKHQRKPIIKYLFIITFIALVILVMLSIEKIPPYKNSNLNVESNRNHNTEKREFTNKSPEDYGANGFDKEPDTASLQKAIDNGNSIVLKSGATYIIDKPLVSTHSISIKSDDSNKNAIIEQRSKESALLINNVQKVFTLVTEKISYNQPFVVLRDTKGLTPGDLIHLVSSKLWYWDNRGYLKKGELHKITKVEGKKVFLERNTQEKYNVGQGEIVTASVYPSMSLELNNISFLHQEPFKTVMVKVNYTSNAKINHVSVTNSKLLGIQLKNTFQSEVHNVKINLGTTKDITSGYGIQDWGGTGTFITNSTFARVRRGVDFSGDTPSRYGMVTNSKAFGYSHGILASGNSGFGTHSTADHITFENNYVKNFSYGFLSRGTNITIKNNTHEGFSRSFIAVTYGNHVTILNNTYQRINDSNLEGFIMLLDSYRGTIVATGNTFTESNAPFIKGEINKLQSLTLDKNMKTTTKIKKSN